MFLGKGHWLCIAYYFKYMLWTIIFFSILMGNLFIYFIFYLSFLSQVFAIHRTVGEGGDYLFNSSLPLPPASQILRQYPADYCRELTSAHSHQPYLNRKSLVSERKLLTTKLLALTTKLQR